MKTGPEIASERSGMPVGVDVPETGQRLASGKISRLKPVSLFASTFASVQANQTCRHALARTQTSLYARKHRPLQRAQIGRNVMTVLAFRSRGRHRTGVPALELIASRKPAAVNAPVCGNCTSINLSEHTDPGFGDYFVCEDCMTQLDTDGSRI